MSSLVLISSLPARSDDADFFTTDARPTPERSPSPTPEVPEPQHGVILRIQ